MEQWKLEKLRSLRDEVRELHPLLRAVFTNDETISRHEYTHGNTEMGADFVIARVDPTLGDENYIGVIAKCGNIKQDHSDVKRQIEECAVERFFDGGKRKIYLNETWIICNGNISEGAERKIHEEYRSRNIKFIKIDRLAVIVDKSYPHFWNEIPAELGTYLKTTLIEVIKAESYNTLDTHALNLDVAQELYEIESTRPWQKVTKYNKSLRVAFAGALKNRRLIMVEGGMGSGKTTLFRKHVKTLCEPAEFQRSQTIPKLLHFSEVADDVAKSVTKAVQDLENAAARSEGKRILLILDGVDEVKNATDGSLLASIEAISALVKATTNLTIVIGSRPIWTIEEGEELLRQCPRFRILPLSFDQIFKVVQHNCASLGISEKLRQDLSRSSLLHAIPRTPMSAILLARVINANIKEIPQTLPELYSKYVELALGRWDIKKGLMTEREYPVVVNVLSMVAKYMLDNELQHMSVNEVIQMLEEYTRTREGLPAPIEIFKRIEQRSEVVIVNRDRHTFSFRHKSLAEYLLAHYQKETHGRGAPFTNPFEGYWLGVEYFYLGLIQDAGKRIDRLSALSLKTEREKMLRLLNFGNLMLSAYQTEYDHIERAVYRVVLEMTRLFLDVRSGRVESKLSGLPEFQFFVILSYCLRDSFEYQYFKRALENAQLQCQCDTEINEEECAITSFFIDAIRAGLKDTDTFKFLNNKELRILPWVVKLGIQHVIKDEKIDLDHVTKLAKRINKARKKNPGLQKYIVELYEGSMEKSRPQR
ncbi:MAG: NACHT domain-containing protein [Candidatus Competibacteraceae bacterium]